MKKIKNIVSVILGLVIITGLSNAQGGDAAFKNRLETIFSQFKNYRYSNISVYKITNVDDIRKMLKDKEAAAEGFAVDANADALKDKLGTEVYNFIIDQARQNKSSRAIMSDIDSRGWKIPDEADLNAVYQKAKSSGPEKRLRNVYAVTTIADSANSIPEVIIGVLVDFEGEDNMAIQLKTKGAKEVYVYPELKQDFDANMQSDFGVPNFYELVMNAFRQGGVKDVTLEAKDFGNLISFSPSSKGNSSSIIGREDDITDSELQTFMRISDGSPLDMKMKRNEVVVAPDLLRWKMYDFMTYKDGDIIDTLSYTTNINMPSVGFEIKYGQEEINYPSLWSERMHARFIWDNAKLGLVLPTAGWSGLTKDVFSIDRKLTYAGIGLTTALDFPMPVIQSSGVFAFTGSYLFGDAEPASYNEDLRKDFLDPMGSTPNDSTNDYLIRFSTQLHYTFAITIDQNYLVRFSLGATVYNAETWGYTKKAEDIDVTTSFLERDDQTVGGVSGKIELMRINNKTPFGLSAQYFDEGIYANAWLQVPIIENTFSLRFDLKGFVKAFAGEPRPWENTAIGIPSISFIMFF